MVVLLTSFSHFETSSLGFSRRITRKAAVSLYGSCRSRCRSGQREREELYRSSVRPGRTLLLYSSYCQPSVPTPNDVHVLLPPTTSTSYCQPSVFVHVLLSVGRGRTRRTARRTKFSSQILRDECDRHSGGFHRLGRVVSMLEQESGSETFPV